MLTIKDRNVNHILPIALMYLREGHTRRIAPRGQPTIEIVGPVATVYKDPRERVMFDPLRNANPFFHFFEALWILDGREDVRFLVEFNRKMAEFSDDGVRFHAPYGYRLRKGYAFDQIETLITLLKKDPDTRQAVLSIWVPTRDLGVSSRDVPCNDMIFVKVRDGNLCMTVFCRSNDAIWGAYGANVVQFSMLQEYLAARVLGSGCMVGEYTQISDSLHVYESNPFWQAHLTQDSGMRPVFDEYEQACGHGAEQAVEPYLLFDEPAFDEDLHTFFDIYDRDERIENYTIDRFKTDTFQTVVLPLMYAHRAYRAGALSDALHHVYHCEASDWQVACAAWLQRKGAV